MDCKKVSLMSNSYHFFPETRNERYDEEVCWPISGKRYFVRVNDVFDYSNLPTAIEDLSKLPSAPNPISGNTNIRRVYFIGNRLAADHQIAKIVKFDENCKISNLSELETEFSDKKLTQSLRKMTYEGLEKMASTASWACAEIPMTVFSLQYLLDEKTPTVKNLDWHRDFNSLSMTSVISEPSHSEVSYYGGSLLFGKRLMDYQKYDHAQDYDLPTVYEGSINEFSYPVNGSFIFENLWSEHKVKDISLHNPHSIRGAFSQRVLFSIFADPNKKQFNAFCKNTQYCNLV